MADAEAEKTTPEVQEKKDEQPSTTTPVFGAAFGSGSGFGGFKGVIPPENKADEEEEQADEEECKAEFKPVVQLEEVEASTGEEEETCLLELCALAI